MIVKNENNNIIRLFDSLISIIDTYCICDTGSTDDTITIIEKYFKNKKIYGKLLSKKFENFEINRNYSLKEARNMADYILLVDADMILNISKTFDKNKLNKDYYYINQVENNLSYYNIRIINNNNNIKYIGVTHEYLNYSNDLIGENLDSINIIHKGDGGSKNDKFKRDIELLTIDFEKNPNNTRTLFYLANSYFDIKNYSKSLLFYEKHEIVCNWDQELFYNYYRQGFCYKHINNIDKMLEMWIKAWIIRPTRAESLYEIIHYYRCINKWHFCKLYYEIAKKINYPKDDILFVHKDIYDYKLLLEYSIFAYYIGEKDLYSTFSKLILCEDINISNILHNYKFYTLKLSFINNYAFNSKFEYKNYLFRSSTPSIIKYNNNYIMNIRYVNYYINNNGNYSSVDNIISINRKIVLSENFTILEEKYLDFNLNNRKYEGIEDIKLLEIDNKILFCGTCFKKNKNIGVAIGEYNKELKYIELNKNPEFFCEKNWVFLPCGKKMIYKWFPLQIGIIENDNLNIIKEINMPNIFKEVRGSTNGFLFDNEIWFIVHLNHDYNYINEPRIYYHMLVKFDINMNLLSLTCPFKFSDNAIEFVCGLIIEQDKIIISHSIWDRESYIKIFDKKYIESLFINM